MLSPSMSVLIYMAITVCLMTQEDSCRGTESVVPDFLQQLSVLMLFGLQFAELLCEYQFHLLAFLYLHKITHTHAHTHSISHHVSEPAYTAEVKFLHPLIKNMCIMANFSSNDFYSFIFLTLNEWNRYYFVPKKTFGSRMNYHRSLESVTKSAGSYTYICIIYIQ